MDGSDIRVRGTPEAGEDDAGPISSATPPRAEPGAPPQRSILRVASSPDDERPAQPRARVSAPAEHRETAPTVTPVAATPAARRPSRLKHAAGAAFRTVMTLLILALALLGAVLIWDYYITAPWTRDGRVRVQVASVTPQISGQITEIRVLDNQFVHKGDVLYVIDPFDFQTALDSDRAQLRMKAADLQVKKVQAQRRQSLTDLATTAEEQQQYVGSAVQADAAFQAAQSQVNQAEINLKRTQVTSPVNGFVTNLLMRVGDYAKEGTSNISIIDSDSYWIDGYFEETKMAHVCVGDRAEAQLMGYRDPIVGHVQTITRGISVSDAAPSTQGLPNVDPVYTWVRLAQRVPVRIAITGVPAGVPLVSGMTATVTIRDAEVRDQGDWWQRRYAGLRTRIDDMLSHPRPSPTCIPAVGNPNGAMVTLATPEPSRDLTPEQINPGLTPGMSSSPKAP